MPMIDWLGLLLPALRLQLTWADRFCPVLSAIPPEATPLRIGLHLSRLTALAPAPLALSPATLVSFGPATAATVPLPKPAMLNYEGNTLVEVVAAPLLDALGVDTGTAARVRVYERLGGADLCVLQTGGFNPSVAGSPANRQLASLITKAGTRTAQDIEIIQGQAPTAWPYVLAACGKPFEHRWATRAMLDVGLAVLHPLIAQTKHHLNVERPQDPSLSTAVAMPGHQSAPSGHSAVAHLLAGLLAPLQPTALPRQLMFSAAASIATNRELAGVHFESDSQAGQALGLSIAAWLTGLAIGRSAFTASFDMNGGVNPAYSSLAPSTPATQEWQWLYQRARAEWT
jgi:membrane-associated phospholipid phosphatase